MFAPGPSSINAAAFCTAGNRSESLHQVRDLELHEPGLAGSEQLAGAAQLEVAPRHLEAVGRVAQHGEAFAGERREGRLIEQHAAALDGTAADAPAQRAQLRQAHPFGVLDDHQRCVRHVDAHFDHGRGDEQVELALLERGHDRVLAAARHAAVHEPDAHARQRRREHRSRLFRSLVGQVSDSSISGHTQ